jgi:hypothetical protein
MNEFFSAFQKWFNASVYASALRVAIAVIVYSAITDIVKAGSFDFSNWQLWFIGGLASFLPMLMRKANPEDTSFDAKG